MWSATGTTMCSGSVCCSTTVMARVHDLPAVEGGDRRPEIERLHEHLHATRGPAARDGEDDAGVAQPVDGGDGAVGEDLVVGDQRPVHVGQQQADTPVRSLGCRVVGGDEATLPAPLPDGATPACVGVEEPDAAGITTPCPRQLPDSHRDLLDGQFATLATVGGDGYPQLSEVWFLAEGDRIAISLNT